MNNIRMLRLQRGMQQKELAIEIGVANATVSDWEHGRKNPSGERLRKLADFFNVSPQVVLGDEEAELEPTEQGEAKEQSSLPGKEEIIKYVLSKLRAPEENLPIESQLIVKAVGKMPQEDREKVLNMMRAVYSEYFDNEEDKIG